MSALGSVHAQSPANGARCYRLVVGPWRPELGNDEPYHRLPSAVRLDTLSWDAKGKHLSPTIAYPYHSSFPKTPRWEESGDTVRLVWSNGFTPTIVTLVRHGATLTGEAVAESAAVDSGERADLDDVHGR